MIYDLRLQVMIFDIMKFTLKKVVFCLRLRAFRPYLFRHIKECSKKCCLFRTAFGKSMINFVSRMPWWVLVSLEVSWHRAFVGISWVPNFFSWVFRGSQIFSSGYFVGPNFILVGNFVVFIC